MIAYGSVIGDEQRWLRTALPGIRRAGGEGTAPIVVRGAGSIFAACNEIIDRARVLPDLEALVIVHDDLELLDRDFEDRLRAALAGAGVVGAVGGVGVTDMGWWQCGRALGQVRWRRPDGGPERLVGPGGGGAVDAIDGLLMALSADALEALRFDEESLGPGFHGYDADICRQARAAGIGVAVAALDCAHVNDGFPSAADRAGWVAAHVRFRRKWDAAPAPEVVLPGTRSRAREPDQV